MKMNWHSGRAERVGVRAHSKAKANTRNDGVICIFLVDPPTRAYHGLLAAGYDSPVINDSSYAHETSDNDTINRHFKIM